MSNEPQFLYLILVLPSLFGLILLGEGINKVIHEDWNGVLTIILGLFFLGMVVLGYFFFSSYLGQKG